MGAADNAAEDKVKLHIGGTQPERVDGMWRHPYKTLSFFGPSAARSLTLANSPLCSGSTRPGIETRYLE
jgi:hypothetical protein